MSNVKKCPMLSKDGEAVPCNNACAWWNADHGKCAVYVLASAVTGYDFPAVRTEEIV